jgi:membrane-associated phospholipid phosphatase
VQRWALDWSWPGEVARWGYANLHFKGSCLALVTIYFGWRGSYGFVRNAVIAAMAISLLGYALYPTAPPRFFGELGFDGGSGVTGNQPELVRPGDALFNPVAAVPSMHVGLSLIFAWSLALLVPWRPLKAALFAYPLLMTYVVVASGNHWWLDAALGALCAALAVGVATLLARLRPDWAFRPPSRGAGGSARAGPSDADDAGPREPAEATMMQPVKTGTPE